MASFSSWNGVKHTGNASLLTDVLKGRMGFKGFVVGDWNAHGQIAGCSTTDCPQALNAGLDMYMASDSWKGLYDHTLAEVKSGVIPMARLDDAVRRILRVKFKAGLFDGPSPAAGRFDQLGSPAHRAIAREAVRKSLVLLKNDGGVLPIRASAQVLVAGDGADDIGKQSGGWTLNWQGVGNKNSDFPHGQSICVGDRRGGAGRRRHRSNWPRTARSNAGPTWPSSCSAKTPTPNSRATSSPRWSAQPGDKRDLALLKRLKAQGVPVVAVFLSGRPLWTNPEINASDAFVAAWLPGTEGGGVADVLIGARSGAPRHDFRGRLSFSWPKRADRMPGHRDEPGYAPLFAYGYGLTYAGGGQVGPLSEDPGVRAESVNLDRYFVAGHTPAPWSLARFGAATVRTVDAGAQENARQLDWTGQGAGAVSIAGGPRQPVPPEPTRRHRRPADGCMRYRLDAAPYAPVERAGDLRHRLRRRRRCHAIAGGRRERPVARVEDQAVLFPRRRGRHGQGHLAVRPFDLRPAFAGVQRTAAGRQRGRRGLSGGGK